MPRRRRALGTGLVVLVIACMSSLLVRYARPPATPSRPPTLTDSGLTFPDVGIVRANPTVPVANSPFLFTEIARAAGIDFVHNSGMTDAKHFPTAYGSGVAIFDADNDGLLDVYFAQCHVPARRNRENRSEPVLPQHGRQSF